MHSVHAPGYSDFFTSGIRLVSRRFAVEGHVRTTSLPAPIPLSFDSESDTDSEVELSKRKSWHTSRFVSRSKYPSDWHPSHSVGGLEGKKRRRRSSLMSITHHIFGSRRPRIPNDESGWLSSASSKSPSVDSIDLINSSAWPECPNGGLMYHPEPEHLNSSEPLDPFSSSPSSRSFFFDVDLQTRASSNDTTIPFRNNDALSLRPPSNRFSLSSFSSTSGSSFFSSSSKRNSIHSFSRPLSPPPDASFLHIPRLRPSRTPVENGRPASIHIMPSSTPKSNIIPPSTSGISRSLSFNHPKSRPAGNSHARTQSLPLSSYSQTRSRVRSLFLSKSAAISVAIPEGDQTENDIDNDNVSDTLTQAATDSDRYSVTREESTARPVIAEEEAPVSASDAQLFFEDTLEGDVSKSMDWREFCMEVLDGRLDAASTI